MLTQMKKMNESVNEYQRAPLDPKLRIVWSLCSGNYYFNEVLLHKQWRLPLIIQTLLLRLITTDVLLSLLSVRLRY
jgi:hypothetical protein